MLDRLIADHPFLIRTVVYDNYPAAREQFEQHIQSGIPQLINTPEKLVEQMVGWSETPQGRDLVNDVLIAVPYRNGTGSAVLSDALAMGREIMSNGDQPNSKMFDIGAAIAGIVTGAASIANGRHATDAQARVDTYAIQQQALIAQQKSERNAKLIKMGIIAGSIVLVIAVLIIFRKRS